MPVLLKTGSTGEDVRSLEQQLAELGLYSGEMDGVFGPGVDSAVRAFQGSSGLDTDGMVGPKTWQALFGDAPAAANPLMTAQATKRCLALTGSFETSMLPPACFSGLAGDFDKMGLSFGALQWNLGQGTLQRLLLDMVSNHGDVVDSVFQDKAQELRDMLTKQKADQLAWARSIQGARFQVNEPWKGMFQELGQTPECQDIQTTRAESTSSQALQLCRAYDLTTVRAHALMFDIVTQNGSVSAATEALIRADFEQITESDPMDIEVARLRIVANRRAEASNPESVEDVRRRKLCIANGQGTVHGLNYDLAGEFGIGLTPLEA